MRFTVLGSGTSSGIPNIGCECPTCSSADPRDTRLRPSLLVESPSTTVLIDSSSDFRQQMLSHKVKKLDAIVYTHHHFDHIGGFDDVRMYNFISHRSLPVFLMQETFDNLERTFLYAFRKPAPVGGGVPEVDINIISGDKFRIGDIEIQPVPMMHGHMAVNGYRIGDFAYCTDTNYISEESLSLLRGLDTLILDALRYEWHPTHFTVDEALDAVKKISPKKTYFTHIAHQIRHAELEARLPDNVRIAYDGLVIECCG